VTKVQMGAQSLDDRILALNQRNHTSADTLRATQRLRAAGFKIVLHWMPNLLGATLASDRIDFSRLWEDGYAPDELKIYPTQLLENTELYNRWQKGEYLPYTTAELVKLVADLKPVVAEYCRINRVIRDIPSSHVIAGNKVSSLRMAIFAELARRGQTCRCVRCREVRGQKVEPADLKLTDLVYNPASAEEHFLTFVTPDDRIAGYLRLSLPIGLPDEEHSLKSASLPDLADAALIREVHVYGQSLPVGGEKQGAAQHIGLGSALLAHSAEIARAKGFKRLAVIAAVGTRMYYEERGFVRGDLYMVKDI
jgi:elongator complex protein 3